MTIIGLFTTLFSLIFLKGKIHRNGYSFITEIGGNWGGVDLGAFSLCGNYYDNDRYWYEHTRRHEFGHSLQNLYLGPFFIFVVAIPSSIRYWMQRKGKLKSEYESIWFEKYATIYGTRAINYIENID